MKPAVPSVILLLFAGCSLVTDADRDRLGPEIDIGGDCATIETCDDGVDCTNDFCDSGTGKCAHEPDDDRCDDGQTCDAENGCRGGATPCDGDDDCVDGAACEVGHCDGDTCAWEPIDADQDGTPKCDDCDDGNGGVHPGAAEECGNGADDDCNGSADGEDAACQHEGCGTELVIREHGEVEGDLDGDSQLNSGRCERGLGPEAIVELVLPQDSDVVLSTDGSDLDTVLYIRQGCDGEELGCSDNRSQARGWLDSRLFMQALPAGTYTIVVDSAERGGHFRLRVESDQARSGSCERPLDISGGGTVVGSKDGGDGAASASCSEPTGPSAAFQFDLEDFSQVTVSTEESDFDLVQDIQRNECGGETPPGACMDISNTGETFGGLLQDGRWVIVLDGFQGASGRYVLRFFP